MDKIPETVLRLIWSCQFSSLELPQFEVDKSQGKPTTQFLASYIIDVYAANFNPLINLSLFDHYPLPMDQTYFDFPKFKQFQKSFE